MLVVLIVLITLIAFGALAAGAHLGDLLDDERRRSAAFERRNNELFSALLQARAQRDALDELKRHTETELFWRMEPKLRVIRGGGVN